MLYKTLTRFFIVLTICSAVSCTAVQPTATQIPFPTAVSTATLEPAPIPATPVLDSNALQLWSQKNSVVNIKARIGIGTANSLAISPDGSFVAVGSITGLYIYQFDTLKEIKRVLFELPVKSVEWSPDGSYLAAASGMNVVLLDAATSEQLYVLSGHQGDVDLIAWSPDSQKLASMGRDYHVMVWDSQTGESMLNTEITDPYMNQHLHWTSNSVVVLGPIGGVLVSLDTNTGRQTSHHMDPTSFEHVT